MKRLITGNTGPNGELVKDKFAIAVLQYRNTPDPETGMSPAQMLFGHPIRDFIPILPSKYRPHKTWQETLTAREEALRNRHMKCAERWSEHTRQLPPLIVGDLVRIQNQVGNFPRKWDKTGQVVEVKQHNQYVVKVDGSGRATLRNRQFLRQYTPVKTRRSVTKCLIDDVPKYRVHPSNDLFRNGEGMPCPATAEPVTPNLISKSPQLPKVTEQPSLTPASPTVSTPDRQSLSVAPRTVEKETVDHPCPSPQSPKPTSNENETSPVLRRSTRERKAPQRLIDTSWADRVKSSHTC